MRSKIAGRRRREYWRLWTGARCSRSTATRSPTAPTTRCRSRSAARTGGRRTRSSASRTSSCGSGTPSSRSRVLVGWDTLEVPTYRHEALAGYQSGPRVRGRARSSSSTLLPALVESFGFACAKAPGYEADDFLAAAAAHWDGPVLVATSDRDAFQLVSDRVTILQPVKGVSELARIGPAEVRERYGVEPGAGAGLHRAPRRPAPTGSRARPASGRRRRRASSRSTAASRRRSPPGASRPSPTSCGSTGGSRRWTPGAPLPELAPQRADWAGAAAHATRARAERPRRAGSTSAPERVALGVAEPRSVKQRRAASACRRRARPATSVVRGADPVADETRPAIIDTGIRLVETIQSRLVTRPSTSRGTSWCIIVPQIAWPSASPTPGDEAERDQLRRRRSRAP